MSLREASLLFVGAKVFFWWYQGWNSQSCICQAGAYATELNPQPRSQALEDGCCSLGSSSGPYLQLESSSGPLQGSLSQEACLSFGSPGCFLLVLGIDSVVSSTGGLPSQTLASSVGPWTFGHRSFSLPLWISRPLGTDVYWVWLWKPAVG